ncbi:TRAP transporter small permease subunit [Chloroflexota bacterium]
MKFVRRIACFFDRTLDLLAVLAATLIIFVMLVIALDIVMRYFLNRPIFWVTEIVEYNLLFITFLGAAWVLRKEGHIRVDIIPSRLKPKARASLNMATSIFVALIWLTITWYSARITWEYSQEVMRFHTLLETPKFAILIIIPIGGLLLFIQSLRMSRNYYGSWRRFHEIDGNGYKINL